MSAPKKIKTRSILLVKSPGVHKLPYIVSNGESSVGGSNSFMNILMSSSKEAPALPEPSKMLHPKVSNSSLPVAPASGAPSNLSCKVATQESADVVHQIPSASNKGILDEVSHATVSINNEHSYGKSEDGKPFSTTKVEKEQCGNEKSESNKQSGEDLSIISLNASIIQEQMEKTKPVKRPSNDNRENLEKRLKVSTKLSEECTNNAAEKVACYKCKFCDFLHLSEEAVTSHAQEKHASHVTIERNAALQCPGCNNVFLSRKSLKVHLSEDHNTAGEELKQILDSFGDILLKFPLRKKKSLVRKTIKKVKTPSISSDCSAQNKNLNTTEEPIRSVVNTSSSDRENKTTGSDGKQTLDIFDSTLADEPGKIRVRHLSSFEEEENFAENANIECSIPHGITAAGIDVPKFVGSKLNAEHGAIEEQQGQDREQYSSLTLEDTDFPEELPSCLVSDNSNEAVNNQENFNTTNIIQEEPILEEFETHNPSTTQTLEEQTLRLNKGPRKSQIKREPIIIAGFRCQMPSCPVQLHSRDNLLYHLRCHMLAEECASIVDHADERPSSGKTPKVKNRFSCPECSKLFGRWGLLADHLWRHHAIDMELHSCDKCNYKASMSNAMTIHKQIHGSIKPYLCDSCGKGFKTPKQLRNHKVVHQKHRKISAGEVVYCGICSRAFADMRMLRNHIEAVHNKIRPYMCSECGHTAANRSSLKMHLRQHTGDRPYKCDECAYQTSDHNSLRRHKKRHTGDKPYKCPMCTYSCIQSSTFKSHLQSKHPGEGGGLLFCCSKCTFQTIKHDIYLTHIAEHDNGNNSLLRIRLGTRQVLPHGLFDSENDFSLAPTSEQYPIFVSIGSDGSEVPFDAPTIEAVVENVAEAIVPGSNVHLLYNGLAISEFPNSVTLNDCDESNLSVKMPVTNVAPSPKFRKVREEKLPEDGVELSVKGTA